MNSDKYIDVVLASHRRESLLPITMGLLLVFWTSIGLEAIGISVPIVRPAVGIALAAVVPGLLLTRLLGIEPGSVGVLAIFSVGTSLAVLSVVTVSASVVLPLVGITDPISFLPLAVLLSVLLSVFVISIVGTERSDPVRHGLSVTPSPVALALLALPALAVVAAFLLTEYGTTVGMILFVISVGVVVLIVPTAVVPVDQYPAVIFFVSLSTLLHRNLASSHVIGADIQLEYFLSARIARSHRWVPDIHGSLSGLPLITSTPAAVSAIAGIDHLISFKFLFVFSFSLVPLGVYYLARDLFDDDIAVFASLFFLFYHITFYFTPGKQQLSQLFVVLLLVLFFRNDIAETGPRVAAVLLTVALVFSHYGTTYVFGVSLLVATVSLLVVDRFIGPVDHDLSFGYPVVFLAGATVWYAYAAPDLLARLAGLPPRLANQFAVLMNGAVGGSGADAVQEQVILLDRLTLYVYVVCTVFIALGIAWLCLSGLIRVYRRERNDYPEFTALAVPLFAILAVSYVVVLGLWADRVYQMVLLVLAPLMPFGFALVHRAIGAVRGETATRWMLLAVILVGLFSLNSGLAFALAGNTSDYTFDDDAHDYAFTEAEVDAAEWLRARPEIRAGNPVVADARSDEVTIYTDQITYQLLRSVLPNEYYNSEVVTVKNDWDSTFAANETSDGYVFIRHSAVTEADGNVSTAYLEESEVEEIRANRSIAFQNEDVTIVEPAVGTNATEHAQ